MNRKQIIILLVLLAVLAGAIFLYQQTYQRWPWQKEIELASPTVTVSPGIDTAISSTPQVKTQRDKIMDDLAQKIASLVAEKPVLGGQWFVDRFWFVNGSDKDLYVEYEDGHIMGRILLEVSEKSGSFTYEVVAHFEPGESDWILKSGKDKQFGKNLDLYEYNDSLKSWEQRN